MGAFDSARNTLQALGKGGRTEDKMKKKFICLALCALLAVPLVTANAEQRNVPVGFEKVLENGRYALLYNSEKDEIAVGTGGNMWYSNPQNRESDTLADSQEKYNLNSQAILYYYSGESLVAMDSYSNSTKLGQTEHKTENGAFCVTYKLGEQKFSINKLPQVISRSRMEKEILPKLDSGDRETLLNRYSLYSKSELDKESYKTVKLNFPAIADHDIYVRGQLPDYLGEEIWSILARIGYTLDDLQRDCDENSVENTYTPSASFELTLIYELTDSGFSVECNPKTVKFSEDYKPVRLELLPFFGAAGTDESGYMLVPDGCGAVIDFNNGRLSSNEYWRTFFGDDSAVIKTETEPKRRELTLPVFAISNRNGGFLAEIESGYECAGIGVDISGKSNSYNNIFPFFTLFTSDSVNISANKSDSNMFIATSENIFSGNIKVNYHFTEEYTAYDGFAALYRNILLKNGGLKPSAKKETGALNIEFIGTALVKKKFLGFPYNTLTPLTDYKKAAKILEELGEDNVNITFTNALEGGKLQKSAAEIKPSAALGSSGDLKKLKKLCGSVSFSYYALRQSKAAKKAISHSVSDEEVKIYEYDPISRLPLKSGALVQLSPSVLQKNSSSVFKSCKKRGITALTVRDIGTYLNSDLGRSRQIDRYKARVCTEKYFEKLSGKIDISADNAGAYAFKYLSGVRNIPVSSSDYGIFSKTVPFYGLVLRGVLPVVTEPVNTSDDMQTQFLKTAELGAELQLSWIYSPAANLQDNTENYYNRSYRDTLKQAKAYYTRLKELYKAVGSSVITGHKAVYENAAEVKYENGVTVLVNYGNDKITYNGASAEPYDFTVIK